MEKTHHWLKGPSSDEIVRWFKLLLFLCTAGSPAGSTHTQTEYLLEHCGHQMDLSESPSHSVKLKLSPFNTYSPFIDCHLTLYVPSHMRISLQFQYVDIQSFDSCTGDYLQIDDSGVITNSSFHFIDHVKSKKYCGTNTPSEVLSSFNNMTLRFVSDAYKEGRGFALYLTAFHEGDCSSSEYSCDNSRCVHEDLYCDDVNNCGDDSDRCELPMYLIAGIVVTSALAVVAVLVLVAVLRYRCKRREMEREEGEVEEGCGQW